MTTLSKRATPQQARIMRAVAGAVRNVAHIHPEWITNSRAAGSIAKRATGTLTAQGSGVLAASASSKQALRLQVAQPQRPPSRVNATATGVAPTTPTAPGLTVRGRAPLSFRALHRQIGLMAREARAVKDWPRWLALVDVSRVIGMARR